MTNKLLKANVDIPKRKNYDAKLFDILYNNFDLFFEQINQGLFTDAGRHCGRNYVIYRVLFDVHLPVTILDENIIRFSRILGGRYSFFRSSAAEFDLSLESTTSMLLSTFDRLYKSGMKFSDEAQEFLEKLIKDNKLICR